MRHQAFELAGGKFKIRNGQISRVEVVLGPRVPYGMRSPFDMKTLWEPR